MSLSRALLAVGLIRPTRRRGYCPACRGWAAPTRGTRTEVAHPALTSLAFLVVAYLIHRTALKAAAIVPPVVEKPLM